MTGRRPIAKGSSLIDRRGFLVAGVGALAACGGDDPSTSPSTPTPTPTPTPSNTDFDIVVYGSSLGGLMAMVRAALRRRLRVCLIEPYAQYGGMHAAGLAIVDLTTDKVIGGDTASIYYRQISDIGGEKYRIEPKNAQLLAERLIAKYAAKAFKNETIEKNDVVLENSINGRRIKGILTSEGLITGKVFIDASYEGDLMAGALGPSGYTYGRESANDFNESHGGYLAGAPGLYLVTLPTVPALGYPFLADPRQTIGEADDKCQAFNFRVPITRDQKIRIPFNKPSDYDPSIYATWLKLMNATGKTTFARDYSQSSLGFQGNINSSKINFNSLDLLNGNIGYADGSWELRRTIMETHNRWQQGLMWCIVNDPVMQSYGLGALQADASDVGLCGDEFAGSSNGPGWPYWLYPREGRRLKALYIMRQRDITATEQGGTPSKSNRIGRWQYTIDIHAVQGFVSSEYRNNNVIAIEGTPPGAQDRTAIYDIPIESLLPLESLCTNLIVPVCSGFTHVAWAPQRLETAFGICGEAAGEIAAWACDRNLPVQRVDYPFVASRLKEFGTLF